MYGRPSGNGRGQNGSNTAGMAAITPIVKNYQTSSGTAASGGNGGGAAGEWGSLNPNLYQNMSNDQVDWAALAQQWIQMKETLPPEMVPAAPPPPMISNHYRSTAAMQDSPPSSSSDGMRLETIDEQGEAPMEVERDEDHHSHSSGQQQQSSAAWQNGTTVSSWQYPAASEWRNPAWETNWSTGGNQSGKPASSYDSGTPLVNPQASMAVANWQAKMSRIYKIPGNDSEPIAGTVQPAGSKPHQTDGSKRIPGLMDQVINLDHGAEDQQGDQDEDTTQTINDAKRKLLPAWIREGLEKMEREKLRQAEREKEQKQREQMLEQRRQAELEALNELESAKKKSKFESDSEEEDAADGNDREGDGRSRDASPAPVRSREEILQELMIAVRKNLTEILLEVTNEEIAVLAKETLAKTRRKAPTAQALRKTGLASLTGGLGLGIYGDSDEDDDDDDDGDKSGSENARDNGGSSGGEDEDDERSLRNTIKQRQKEFEWTAREIEDQLAQDEAREERKRREYEQQQSQNQQSQRDNSDDEDAYGAGSSSRAGFGHAAGAGGSVSGGKSGSRDGETHQPVNDKIYANKLGRTRDKRISRFSDPKDTVRQTHITHVAIVTHKPGDVIQPLQLPKVVPTATAISSGISPPPVVSAPLFPAAVIGSLESYRRGSSVASETPSNASSSRASSSHRSGRERGHREKSSSSSSHRSHKSKKHKRSRYSRSDDENECYVEEERDDDRYSQYSRRSRSSERSSHSRRRRSYSRESREESRSRRSRSPRDHRYRPSRRSRSRTRSPLSRRGRY